MTAERLWKVTAADGSACHGGRGRWHAGRWRTVAVGAAIMAVATLAWLLRPERREYAMVWREDDDGVQPWDPRTTATGLADERRG